MTRYLMLIKGIERRQKVNDLTGIQVNLAISRIHPITAKVTLLQLGVFLMG